MTVPELVERLNQQPHQMNQTIRLVSIFESKIMTYELTVTDTEIIFRADLETIHAQINGKTQTAFKLPFQLAFACKPMDMDELYGGCVQNVYVFKRIDLAPHEFDAFSQTLWRKFAPLKDQFWHGPLEINSRACLMFTSPNRPLLFVDTQGFDYPRYVARLG